MQNFSRLSAVILIVSLVLLTAPPARADHVIAVESISTDFFALTNTGEVYVRIFGTWTFIGTVPGGLGLAADGLMMEIFSVQGTTVFKTFAFKQFNNWRLGSPMPSLSLCSGSPIRSFVVSICGGVQSLKVIHQDGTICVDGSTITGPDEPVVPVEEQTWGKTKDTFGK